MSVKCRGWITSLTYVSNAVGGSVLGKMHWYALVKYISNAVAYMNYLLVAADGGGADVADAAAAPSPRASRGSRGARAPSRPPERRAERLTLRFFFFELFDMRH